MEGDVVVNEILNVYQVLHSPSFYKAVVNNEGVFVLPEFYDYVSKQEGLGESLRFIDQNYSGSYTNVIRKKVYFRFLEDPEHFDHFDFLGHFHKKPTMFEGNVGASPTDPHEIYEGYKKVRDIVVPCSYLVSVVPLFSFFSEVFTAKAMQLMVVWEQSDPELSNPVQVTNDRKHFCEYMNDCLEDTAIYFPHGVREIERDLLRFSAVDATNTNKIEGYKKGLDFYRKVVLSMDSGYNGFLFSPEVEGTNSYNNFCKFVKNMEIRYEDVCPHFSSSILVIIKILSLQIDLSSASRIIQMPENAVLQSDLQGVLPVAEGRVPDDSKPNVDQTEVIPSDSRVAEGRVPDDFKPTVDKKVIRQILKDSGVWNGPFSRYLIIDGSRLFRTVQQLHYQEILQSAVGTNGEDNKGSFFFKIKSCIQTFRSSFYESMLSPIVSCFTGIVSSVKSALFGNVDVVVPKQTYDLLTQKVENVTQKSPNVGVLSQETNQTNIPGNVEGIIGSSRFYEGSQGSTIMPPGGLIGYEKK